MQFLPLGATDEVNASAHFLKLPGTGLLLDAGANPSSDGPESVPDYASIRDAFGENGASPVEHAIITHAHHDHFGTLPVLVKEFPHVEAHMTRATRKLIDFLLPASARLQRRRQKEGSTHHDPLFTENDLEEQGALYHGHDLETAFDVGGKTRGEVEATLYDAGHILGSAGVLLEFKENGRDRRVFYSSDTNTEAQAILPGGRYPEEPVDVLILETTGGADAEAEKTTRAHEEEKFCAALKRTMERGGAALVPVFVMGRAQEVLALIDRFKRRGDLDPEIPVYTAGSMRAIADLHDQTRETTPRLNPGFRVFGVDQKKLPYGRKKLKRTLDGPAIHVVSSGMMFGRTLSNRLARDLIGDPKSAILRVGYAVEDSPADRLMKAHENGGTVTLSEESGPQEIEAEIGRFRLSGHSHRQQLLSVAERLDPEKIVLVHGETEAKDWMAEHLAKRLPNAEILRPQQGETLEV